MLARVAVREPIIEPRRSGVAFVHLLAIRAIPKQGLFLAVLQLLQHLTVMHLGCGHLDRMNNGWALGLYADMPFGPEVPFVVLAGGTHLGISFFSTVVLAHRRRQQGRIHNRPRL